MKKTAAYTLVELMVTFLIIAILSAIGISGYSKYVNKTKMAEAYTGVDVISKKQAAYYIENKTFAYLTGNPAMVPSSSAKQQITAMTSGTNWPTLGYPFPVGTYTLFNYMSCAGHTDSSGNNITNAISPCVPITQYQGTTVVGIQGCTFMTMGNYVTTTGKPQYHWALTVASSNFKSDSGSLATCTRVYKLIDTGTTGKVNLGGSIGVLNSGE